MIESLTAENFQPFQYFHLEFDPNVTCLVAPSDSGKSSIIRLLYWVMTNQLRGDYFVHHGADFARGTLRIDGHEIIREKGSGKNLYHLDGHVPPYEAFGTGVPEDIERLVRVSRDNFQLQLDSPYLFGLSPGEVSKQLNSVVNLDLIDSSLSFLASEQRKAKSTVAVSEERLEQAIQKRDDLRWAKDADVALRALEGDEEELDKRREGISKLEKLLDEIDQMEKFLADADRKIEAMEGIVTAGEALQEKMKERDALAGLLSDIAYLDKRIGIMSKEMEGMEEELREGLQGKCPVCGSDASNLL